MEDNRILDCNLIVDCDEILYNISPKWCRGIYERKEIFEPYLRIDILERAIKEGENFDDVILSRDKFYITEWLKKDNVDIPENIFKEFMNIYNAKDYYDDLKPTAMGIGISRLSRSPNVKKVYAVSRHAENESGSRDSKIRAIKGLFPSNKLELKIVGRNEKKSDAIKGIDITNGFIFEDEMNNILDYLTNAENVTHCNICVPVLGYNLPSEQIIKLMEEREVCFLTY